MSEKFSHKDQLHLRAASGWIELGNHLEAGLELDQINPLLRASPEVLQQRLLISALAREWPVALQIARTLTELTPDDVIAWIQQSYALHELKRTAEARDKLLSVLEQFPNYGTVRYNLGCYECVLGNVEKAEEWLKQAFELPGGKELRAGALEDPDLAPLWKRLSAIIKGREV